MKKPQLTIIAVSFTLVCLILIRIANHCSALVTAALVNMPTTVVIDAGHGGEDGGALSYSGVRESRINLAIAQKLDLLMNFCGVQTVMTRQDESAVHTQGDTIRERKKSDLNNRVRMINETPRAVLISIHQNHFSDEKYSGPQVFYAGTDGSRELAALVQSCLFDAIDPIENRQIKKSSSVYLMENILVTGVLVECGFLSNPQEDRMLQTQEHQKKIACALSSALTQFIQEGNHEFEI